MSGQSPPKRPRLSLQIKALSTGPTVRTSRTLAAVVNPTSPTSFNTLSNVYSSAIERASTPVLDPSSPVTAIKTTGAKHLPALPRLQMPASPAVERRTQTPFITTQFPETPLTARPLSPAVAMEVRFPNTMTATPPLSAGPEDAAQGNQVFCFSPSDILKNSMAMASLDDIANDGHNTNTNTQSGENGSTNTSSNLGNLGSSFSSVSSLSSLSSLSNLSSMGNEETDKPAETQAADPEVVGVISGDMAIGNTSAASHANAQPVVATPAEVKPAAAAPQIQLPSSEPQTPSVQLRSSTRRRMMPGMMAGNPAPYVHPRSLRSILRNSPLPPGSARSPISPRRQSQRLIERASRHVMYNSPLTQTITTNRYTKSHIDLLCEDASPFASPATPSPATGDEMPGGANSNNSNSAEMVLDMAMAYTRAETRDGGQTPGPFEEMRRRLAGLETATPTSAISAGPMSAGPMSAVGTPVSPGSSLTLVGSHSNGGIRKRKQPAATRKDRKRRWVWTLGQEDEDEENLSGAILALKAAQKKEEEAAAAAAAAAASTPTSAATAPSVTPGTTAASASIATSSTEVAATAALPSTETASETTGATRHATRYAMRNATARLAPLSVPSAGEDVDMMDSAATPIAPKQTMQSTSAASSGGTADTKPTETTDPKKPRKSTPVPYASDYESDGSVRSENELDSDMDDMDGDVDMSTPVDRLGPQLAGPWMKAAAAWPSLNRM